MMEFLQNLAELSEIASLYVVLADKYKKDLPSSVIYRQLDEQLSPSQRSLLEDPENQRIVEALIIDKGLLDTIEKKIEQVAEDYQRRLNARTPQEREAADWVADRQICEWLNRVRDKNGGDLPTEKLRNFWAAHSCIRF